MLTKLIVEEFVNKGEKYFWFVDPETGKYYRPKISFEVTGNNLEDLFEEITDFSYEAE